VLDDVKGRDVGACDGGSPVTDEHPAIVWAREFIDALVAVIAQGLEDAARGAVRRPPIEGARNVRTAARDAVREEDADPRTPDPDVILRLWRNRVLDAGTGDLVDALAEAIRQRDAARALLACDRPNATGAQECAEWLAATLAGGERPSQDVKRDAKAAGFTAKNLRQARERLGVVARREGFPSATCWALPEAYDRPTAPSAGGG
jgi:hypothetical protein